MRGGQQRRCAECNTVVWPQQENVAKAEAEGFVYLCVSCFRKVQETGDFDFRGHWHHGEYIERLSPEQESQVMTLWAIYASPRDYPGKYVVRRWILRRGTKLPPLPEPDPAITDSLDQARASIPPGRQRLERTDDDVTSLVESWI